MAFGKSIQSTSQLSFCLNLLVYSLDKEKCLLYSTYFVNIFIQNTFKPQIKGSNSATYINDVRQPAVVHNLLWLTKIFTPFHRNSPSTNKISHQQLWNVIIIAVIVLYFWIYNVLLDLTWYYCNHIVLMKLYCIQNSGVAIHCLACRIWSGIG